jgi:hypothetical protein
MPVRLDLNNSTFQEHWFALEKEEQLAVLHCCGKLAKMEWDAIYRDKGLRWELIHSRTGRDQERLYSIRMSRKVGSSLFGVGSVCKTTELSGHVETGHCLTRGTKLGDAVPEPLGFIALWPEWLLSMPSGQTWFGPNTTLLSASYARSPANVLPPARSRGTGGSTGIPWSAPAAEDDAALACHHRSGHHRRRDSMFSAATHTKRRGGEFIEYAQSHPGVILCARMRLRNLH